MFIMLACVASYAAASLNIKRSPYALMLNSMVRIKYVYIYMYARGLVQGMWEEEGSIIKGKGVCFHSSEVGDGESVVVLSPKACLIFNVGQKD